MHEIDINRIDLNLLKVFMALIEEGSVTAAANRLGLAQSSMSHALSRLREVFNDQLFVRGTSGMKPTPLAIQMAEPISSTLSSLQSTLDQVSPFDPSNSKRTFDIVLTDACEMTYLPRLMNHLSKTAPLIQIATHQLNREEYRTALESGEVDLALGQLPPEHVDFYQQTLTKEEFVCLVRRGHPLEHNLTMNAYLEAEHLDVGQPALAARHVRKALSHKNSRRKLKLNVRHYLSVPFVIEQTDLIATLPGNICEYTSRFENIVSLNPPFEISPAVMRQFWHKRVHQEAGCKWLREQIASLFLEVNNQSKCR